MRLWTIHPSYLDTKGLVAAWREALLAQKVLLGQTKGYRNHPQLERFKSCSDPLEAMDSFLKEIFAESEKRGYHFDPSKIRNFSLLEMPFIEVNDGQVFYEFEWLKSKLSHRDPAKYEELKIVDANSIRIHPLFKIRKGTVESWEKF